MKTPRTALVVFALISCSTFSFSQRPSMSSSSRGAFDSPVRENSAISGSVLDIHNRPLKDVRVELTNENGVSVSSAYTNSSGSFEFSHIAPGAYTLVATAGLQQTSEQVEVNGWTNNVALRLSGADQPEDGVNGNAISVAQYKVPGKAREEYRKAREAMQKEKTDDAGKHIARALEICPQFADALTLRAVLELDRKSPQAAMADLDQAVKADANYAMAYMVMGSALNMQGKYDEAIRSLQRGEALAPDYWQAHFEMGKAYIGKGDYSNALGQLQRAQALAPAEYALIYLLQAHALLAMKQYPEAMSALQSYLQKEPKGPHSEEAEKMLQQAQSFAANNSR